MRIRRLGAVMVATPVAAAVTVLGATTPALAATGITAPGAETITEGSVVTVSARADNVLNTALQIAAPGSDDFETIASGGNLLGSTYLSKTIGIARNGVYKVRLTGGLTGATYDSRSFTVRVPPAVPGDLRTSASGRTVVVRWKRGPESDLTGYRIAATGTRTRTRSTEDMCAGTECMTTVTLPAEAIGQVPVYLKALRSDGSGGTIASKAAGSKVDLTGGPVSAGLPNTGLGLPGPAPDVPLSPLQINAPFTLPSVTPDGATPGFQYPAPEPEVAAPGEPVSAAANTAAITPYQWGKSLATSLILLVIAAHLGTWTRRVRMAEARGGNRGDVRRAPGGRAEGDTEPAPAAKSAKAETPPPVVSPAPPAADRAPRTSDRTSRASDPAPGASDRTPGAAERPPGAADRAAETAGRTNWTWRPASERRPGHRATAAAKTPGHRIAGSGYRGRRRAN